MNQLIAEAYNKAAGPYLAKYEARGVRAKDVDLALSFVLVEEPFVFEIGYGGGIEAEYVLQKTGRYLGVDISEAYQQIAQKRVPTAQFMIGDIHTYELPNNIDVVLAFASLLHSSKKQLETLLQDLHKKLNQAGVILLSLKKREGYQRADVTDDYTTRRFYYYDRHTLESLTKELYRVVYYDEQERQEPWLTMVLQKI